MENDGLQGFVLEFLDMVHEMRLNPKPFEKVSRGEKVFEIRFNDEKRRLLRIDDLIVFTHQEDPTKKLQVRIVRLVHTACFEDLFHEIGTASAGWEAGTDATQASTDMRRSYSQEEENQHGVVGIGIEIVTQETASKKRAG